VEAKMKGSSAAFSPSEYECFPVGAAELDVTADFALAARLRSTEEAREIEAALLLCATTEAEAEAAGTETEAEAALLFCAAGADEFELTAALIAQ